MAAVTSYDADSELTNVNENLLLPVPAELSSADRHLQQVAAASLDWSTAYGMVERAAAVQKDQRVFIHGLSGSVGSGLMSLCKLKGARIYGTASKRNHEALKAAGRCLSSTPARIGSPRCRRSAGLTPCSTPCAKAGMSPGQSRAHRASWWDTAATRTC